MASNGTRTHYQVLGVLETATAEEIKKAYRRLARKHHPDTKGEDKAAAAKAENRFKDLNEAHEILSDPRKRQAYDQSLRNPTATTQSGPTQPVTVEGIFSAIFGEAFGHGPLFGSGGRRGNGSGRLRSKNGEEVQVKNTIDQYNKNLENVLKIIEEQSRDHFKKVLSEMNEDDLDLACNPENIFGTFNSAKSKRAIFSKFTIKVKKSDGTEERFKANEHLMNLINSASGFIAKNIDTIRRVSPSWKFLNGQRNADDWDKEVKQVVARKVREAIHNARDAVFIEGVREGKIGLVILEELGQFCEDYAYPSLLSDQELRDGIVKLNDIDAYLEEHGGLPKEASLTHSFLSTTGSTSFNSIRGRMLDRARQLSPKPLSSTGPHGGR